MPKTPVKPTLADPHKSIELRFGVALAKTRTLHRESMRKAAMRFLKQARKQARMEKHRSTKKTNNRWSKMANLKPVIEFLATK